MTTDTLTDDQRTRRRCDRIVELAAEAMVEEGAPVPMILDRMLTYAAAQACQIDGSKNTATVFRQLAANIESGIFDHLDRTKRGRH